MRFSLFLNHSALALSLSIATSMFSNARARVYEYTFTDINGAQKSVPESAPYLNPHGNFNALLIGGLDQQIRLTVTRDADNSAVYSTTTISSLLMTGFLPLMEICFTERLSLFHLSVMVVTP